MDNISWQPGVTLEQMEEAIIKKALRFYNQNQIATAQSLGISAKTLYNKLKSYKEKEEKKSKETKAV